MNSNDEETQVFIVRLWRELREIEGARPLLRGTVEHVPSGERCSVRDVSAIRRFSCPISRRWASIGILVRLHFTHHP